MRSLAKISMILSVAALAAGFGALKSAQAGPYLVGPRVFPVYPSNPYYGTPVIIQERVPLIIERTGSNDYLYQYDNVYGPEASAAGRMTRTVVNPAPQLYIRGY